MNTAIGLDVSTQGVKAIVLDDNGAISARTAHSFAEPFRPDPDPTVRVCDPLVWLDGADRALRDLSALGVDVAALPIGIAAQQHGTVYTRADGSLSRRLSPIWMDTSAAHEADELERRFGNEMLRRTGSRAQARFAAAQILKFVRTDPAAFAETARIDLVSSYVARHLTGASEIDFCDAAGMNLMNLATGDWDREICDYISNDLVSKLPRISRGLPFTGDNPATLVGCGADRPGTAVISLGTSDVFMSAVPEGRTDPQGLGHLFGNPSGGLMALVCIKNGSLARDRVRRECGLTWDEFDAACARGPENRIAFPFFESEITPPHGASGIEANFDWTSASAETKARSVIRGQVENLYRHTRWIGDFNRIIVTGGGSASDAICREIYSAFKAEVVRADSTDSAALGAARLARRPDGDSSILNAGSDGSRS